MALAFGIGLLRAVVGANDPARDPASEPARAPPRARPAITLDPSEYRELPERKALPPGRRPKNTQV